MNNNLLKVLETYKLSAESTGQPLESIIRSDRASGALYLSDLKTMRVRAHHEHAWRAHDGRISAARCSRVVALSRVPRRVDGWDDWSCCTRGGPNERHQTRASSDSRLARSGLSPPPKHAMYLSTLRSLSWVASPAGRSPPVPAQHVMHASGARRHAGYTPNPPTAYRHRKPLTDAPQHATRSVELNGTFLDRSSPACLLSVRHGRSVARSRVGRGVCAF